MLTIQLLQFFRFMADVEAWQELSELYIIEQDFNKAAFCLEELILHNPHNHLLHQRYADIKYTQGGLENIELARSYYCQALKLNPKNIRALYGLYLVFIQKKKVAIQINFIHFRQPQHLQHLKNAQLQRKKRH
jgi:Tfp pilus assembly protein PilF